MFEFVLQQSYHIVINGYCYHRHAKIMGYVVIKKMGHQLGTCVVFNKEPMRRHRVEYPEDLGSEIISFQDNSRYYSVFFYRRCS